MDTGHDGRALEGQERKELGLLRSVVENANDAILVTEGTPIDEPGPRIIYVYETFTRMIGYTLDAVRGQTPRILQGPETDPESPVLEITESAVMEDAQANAETLRELKSLGVRIAVDDFGTGYSSLAYLKRFPVDFLKIDRSFVAGMGEDADDEGIVSSVVNLAHTLRLEAVAEGVESEGQRAHLRKMGCELAQGYYFWKPMPAEAASSFLSTNVAPSSP